MLSSTYWSGLDEGWLGFALVAYFAVFCADYVCLIWHGANSRKAHEQSCNLGKPGSTDGIASLSPSRLVRFVLVMLGGVFRWHERRRFVWAAIGTLYGASQAISARTSDQLSPINLPPIAIASFILALVNVLHSVPLAFTSHPDNKPHQDQGGAIFSSSMAVTQRLIHGRSNVRLGLWLQSWQGMAMAMSATSIKPSDGAGETQALRAAQFMCLLSFQCLFGPAFHSLATWTASPKNHERLLPLRGLRQPKTLRNAVLAGIVLLALLAGATSGLAWWLRSFTTSFEGVAGTFLVTVAAIPTIATALGLHEASLVLQAVTPLSFTVVQWIGRQGHPEAKQHLNEPLVDTVGQIDQPSSYENVTGMQSPIVEAELGAKPPNPLHVVDTSAVSVVFVPALWVGMGASALSFTGVAMALAFMGSKAGPLAVLGVLVCACTTVWPFIHAFVCRTPDHKLSTAGRKRMKFLEAVKASRQKGEKFADTISALAASPYTGPLTVMGLHLFTAATNIYVASKTMNSSLTVVPILAILTAFLALAGILVSAQSLSVASGHSGFLLKFPTDDDGRLNSMIKASIFTLKSLVAFLVSAVCLTYQEAGIESPDSTACKQSGISTLSKVMYGVGLFMSIVSATPAAKKLITLRMKSLAVSHIVSSGWAGAASIYIVVSSDRLKDIHTESIDTLLDKIVHTLISFVLLAPLVALWNYAANEVTVAANLFTGQKVQVNARGSVDSVATSSIGVGSSTSLSDEKDAGRSQNDQGQFAEGPYALSLHMALLHVLMLGGSLVLPMESDDKAIAIWLATATVVAITHHGAVTTQHWHKRKIGPLEQLRYSDSNGTEQNSL